MLNKKNVRILSIVLMVVVMLVALGSVCSAVTIPGPSDVNESDISGLNNTVGRVLGIMQWGGYAIAVVVAIVIGIKYITASPDGKAEVKKTLGFYVAGIAIIVAASSIVGAIANGVGGAGTVTTSAIINSINA